MLSKKEELLYLSAQGFAWGVLKRITPESCYNIQIDKMREEAQELKDARSKGDLMETLDAIGDIYQCYLMAIMLRDNSQITSLSIEIDEVVTGNYCFELSLDEAIDRFLNQSLFERTLLAYIVKEYGVDALIQGYKMALETIKPRKGKMINGKFEKEAD